MSLFENEGDWSIFLSNPTLFSHCSARASRYQSSKNLEQTVSQSLGIHDIFAELSLVGTEAYQDYLLSLQSSQQQFHTLLRDNPELRELSIRIHSSTPMMTSTSDIDMKNETHSIHIDPTLGVICVPLHSAVPDILSFLDRFGYRALKIVRSYYSYHKHYDEVLTTVKRQCRIRRLSRSNSISENEMLSCCERLLNHQSFVLRNGMENLEVLVGLEYQYNQNNGLITIPWNWSDGRAEQRRPPQKAARSSS